MTIKPNTLCWLVDPGQPYHGGVVTAICRVAYGRGNWWLVEGRCLRPIVDPDADLSEPAADPLHDDLVDKLRFTRAAEEA